MSSAFRQTAFHDVLPDVTNAEDPERGYDHGAGEVFGKGRALPPEEPIDPDAVHLEPARVTDVNCIINDWAASYANSPASRFISPEIFKVEQRARIMRLISGAQCHVVRPKGNLRNLLGWISFDLDERSNLPIVHYIYVKLRSRRRRVGSMLMHSIGWEPGRTCWTTHWCASHRYHEDRCGWMYNPYLLEVK
jgi:hypothetical protein